MKLLLTSAGLTNKVLRKEFIGLFTKNPRKAKVAFISTAAVPEEDKSYVKEDLENLKKAGICKIQIIEVSKMDKGIWIPKLMDSDAVYIEGGNTYFLLDWTRKADLDKELIKFLKQKNKIYVGSSAGTILTGPTIETAGWKLLNSPADQNIVGLKNLRGLNLVNFIVSPHYMVKQKQKLKWYAKQSKCPVYAIDNNMAILVAGRNIKLVGNGHSLKL